MNSGLDLQHVNADIRPQDDLYRHVNGQWLEENHIPDDRSSFGAFHVLVEKSETSLRLFLPDIHIC